MISINYFTYSPVLIATIFLGLFILLRNRQDRAYQIFAAYVLSMGLWVIALLIADTSQNYNIALAGTKAALIGPALVPAFLFIFSLVFPFRRKVSLRTWVLTFLPALIFIILSPTELNVISIQIQSYGAEVNPGILYYVLLVYYLTLVVLATINFVKSYKKSTGLEKLQLRYIIIGVLSSVILGLITNLVLVVLGISALSVLGPYAAFVSVGFISYAIFRYKLLDIRLVVIKSVMYTFTVTGAVSLYWFLIFIFKSFLETYWTIPDEFFFLTISLITIVSFYVFKNLFQRISYRIFFRASQNPTDLVNLLSDDLVKSIRLSRVISKVKSFFSNQLATPVSFYLFHDSSAELRLVSNKHKKKIPGVITDGPIYEQWSRSGDIILLDQLRLKYGFRKEEDNKTISLIKALDKNSFAALVPLKLKSNSVGLLVLGYKRSGEPLYSRDLKVLDLLQKIVATSTNNAALYEKQKRFAEILVQKVKEATAELRVANIKLKKLDKAKTEFLSIASHQLRSPMTGIKGYMSMITAGDFGKVSPEQNKILSTVMVNTEGLIQLVNLFLDVTRIEEGRFDLVGAKTNMAQLVEEVVTQIQPQAQSKNIKLKFVQPKKNLPPAFVDPQKIKQAIVNLVDNAVKYTPKGSVTVKLTISKKTIEAPKGQYNNIDKGDLSGRRISLCVQDSGIGLEQEDIDQLYEKFFRVTRASTVFTGGSGLGLFVVKKVVELHGGDLAVWSPGKNKGSTFCFSVGVKPPQSVEKNIKAPAQHSLN